MRLMMRMFILSHGKIHLKSKVLLIVKIMIKISLSEEKLNKIIKESVNRIVGDSIDVDKEKMEVGFNINHQEYMLMQMINGIQSPYIIQ